MRRTGLLSAATALSLLAGAGPALAARPAEPGATTTTTHVRVHYDPARTTLADAQALAADTEEAYGRLVGGAGGTPNAGLRAPVSDGAIGGDSRVDVYMVDTSSGGGQVLPDTTAEHSSAYVMMDPDLSRGGTRFRAAHEFMHVIEHAYTGVIGLFSESLANWAAEWALPDMDTVDSPFGQPDLPMDCLPSAWGADASTCGYRQWLFMQRQVERTGVSFVDRWLTGMDGLDATYGATENDRVTLNAALVAGTPSMTLRQAYADYIWRLWDPTAWTTTAVTSITGNVGEPVATRATVTRSAADTQTSSAVLVDHLSTSFVRIAEAGPDPTGPGDQLRITVAKPAGVAQAPVALVADQPDGGRTRVVLDSSCGGLACKVVPIDPATVRDVVVALTNDMDPGATTSTTTWDNQPFTWRAELLPGTATPPANDLQSGALDTPLATEVSTDVAYAGGLGEQEAPCNVGGATVGATRGVWFHFTAPNTGGYLFDATKSDYRTVLNLGGSCAYAPSRETGVTAGASLTRGQSVDLYVGRHSTSRSLGHTARLTVTGPAAPPVTTTTTTTTTTPPPPTSTTTTTPPPVDTTAPVMRVLARTVRASRTGTLTIRLTCPPAETRCSGTLALPRTRRVALGSARFVVAGGKTISVRIRLSAAARRMLRKARQVRVTARLTVRDAAGNARTTRITLTLRAPAR